MLSVLNGIAMNNADKEYLTWNVGFHKEEAECPKEWYAADVPGAVQLDYANAKKWGDYSYAENWKDYLWMEDMFWTYKTTFQKPQLEDGEQYYFVSKGIDYKFEIILNGKNIYSQEGMFKPIELNLTKELKTENNLEVLIYPAPKIPGKRGRSNAAQSVKPAVSYGWDWHPRLVPSGIWDDTYMEKRNKANLIDVFIDYILDEDCNNANINLKVEGNNISDKNFEWKLCASDGSIVFSKTGKISELKSASFKIEKPNLWWTHDHGTPYLYTSELCLIHGNQVLDKKTQKIGFRRIRLVMHQGAWDMPGGSVKTRNNPPFTLELNGRVIFAKGSNWVNPEIFPGIITEGRYNELLENGVKCNFNIFRVWGGGIINKEMFYDLCDQKGILVWTEFPLACNNYFGSPHYLNTLQQESEAIIKRIRKHPSQAIWSGGNELFNAWSGMTDQSKALRLLNSQCYSFDPETPFIPTSPIMGVRHGHYIFKDKRTGEEVFQWMPHANATAYTEFGVPGTASVELLKKIIPENELFPPRPGTSWESHHAFKSWRQDTWLMPSVLKDYFGEAANLEELVQRSQWLQSEGYKCIFEEARRQKPICSMALNWCYNEPWITAANNSLICYPNQPKPAFYAVANSCRPFLASARIPKFSWTEGEMFSVDIFILNDMYENIPSGRLNVKLVTEGHELELINWDFESAQPNQNIIGPTVSTILPKWNTDKFELELLVEGQERFSSSYTLQYYPLTKN